MEKEEFLELLLEILESNGTGINMNTEFNDYYFDSFSKLKIIMLIDTCMNKTVTPDELIKCKVVGDIVDLAFSSN